MPSNQLIIVHEAGRYSQLSQRVKYRTGNVFAGFAAGQQVYAWVLDRGVP